MTLRVGSAKTMASTLGMSKPSAIRRELGEDRAVGGGEAGEGVGALGGGVLTVGEEQLGG